MERDIPICIEKPFDTLIIDVLKYQVHQIQKTILICSGRRNQHSERILSTLFYIIRSQLIALIIVEEEINIL